MYTCCNSDVLLSGYSVENGSWYLVESVKTFPKWWYQGIVEGQIVSATPSAPNDEGMAYI